MQIGNLILQEKSIIHHNGKMVHVTKIEHNILQILAEYEGTDVEKNNLLKQIYGQATRYNSRSFDVHVCHLRHKIEGSDIEIKRIKNFGLRLIIKTPEYA